MVIIIDSRETKALKFRCDHILTGVRVEKLDHGDYAAEYIDETRCPVLFERKSLPDLFATLTRGHARFREEIKRADKAEHKLILIVEGSVSDILGGIKHSKMDGATILKMVLSMWIKYDLMPVFCTSRSEMSLFIKEFYESFGRNYVTGKTS